MIQKELKDANMLGQFIPLHYHFQMLSDKFRMNAFNEAISQTVKSGDYVVDLGSGTGILSFLAARQGAIVTAVEFNPELVAASRKFLDANGMSDRIQVIEADASSWLPDRPADIVICEMLHSALLREKQVRIIADFRTAHAARFGKIPEFIPAATLLAMQPVWQNYDFCGYHAPVPFFQSSYARTDDCIPSCDPKVYKIVDYETDTVETFQTDQLFQLSHDASVNAVRFITKSVLSMNLKTGATVDWHSQHLVFPLQQPLKLKAGQSLNVRFHYQPGDSMEQLESTLKVKTD